MEPEETGRAEDLVELTVVHHDVEASMIKSLLEEAGIDCLLVSQVPHSVYPFTVDGLGEIRLKVLASKLEEARAIVEDALRGPDDGEDSIE